MKEFVLLHMGNKTWMKIIIVLKGHELFLAPVVGP